MKLIDDKATRRFGPTDLVSMQLAPAPARDRHYESRVQKVVYSLEFSPCSSLFDLE